MLLMLLVCMCVCECECVCICMLLRTIFWEKFKNSSRVSVCVCVHLSSCAAENMLLADSVCIECQINRTVDSACALRLDRIVYAFRIDAHTHRCGCVCVRVSACVRLCVSFTLSPKQTLYGNGECFKSMLIG